MKVCDGEPCGEKNRDANVKQSLLVGCAHLPGGVEKRPKSAANQERNNGSIFFSLGIFPKNNDRAENGGNHDNQSAKSVEIHADPILTPDRGTNKSNLRRRGGIIGI